MMKVRMIILLIIAAILLLTGGLNERNIHDATIVLGIGIDILPKNSLADSQNIFITVEVANYGSGEQKTGGAVTSKIISAKGRTLVDAINNIAKIITNQIFWGHVRCIFIGKSLAEAGINQYIDYFYRSNDISPMAFIIICNGEARELMGGMVATGTFFSLELPSNLEIIKGFTRGTALNQYIERMLVPHSSMPLTTIGFSMPNDLISSKASSKDGKEAENKRTIEFQNVSILDSQGKLKDQVGLEGDMAIMLWRNNMTNQIVTLKRDNGDTINVLINSWKVKHEFSQESGRLKFILKCKASAVLMQEKSSVDYRKKEAYEQLKKEISDKLASMFKRIWEHSKDTKLDFLLIGDTMRKQNYKEWVKMSDNWEEEFTKIPAEFDIKTSLNADTSAFQNFFKKPEGIDSYREKR